MEMEEGEGERERWTQRQRASWQVRPGMGRSLRGLDGLFQHRGQRRSPTPRSPRTAQASAVPHQLFTCRMVSPVSCASCFFCSSEGYGCCGHQQESPCLPGHHRIPTAWPARSPRMASPGWGRGRKSPGRGASLCSPGPNRGKQSEASGNYARGRPRLFQQLEANWPALIQETRSLGTALHGQGRRQSPATSLSESVRAPCPSVLDPISFFLYASLSPPLPSLHPVPVTQSLLVPVLL